MDKLFKDIKCGIKLSKSCYINNLISAKTILLFIIEAAFIITVYKNIGKWLRYTDNTISVFELLPYTFMQGIPFLVVIIGIIVIMSDLPCVSDRTRYEIVRINKRAYLFAQFAYCIEITITYFLYIWMVVICVALPKIKFSNEWSYFIKIATKGTGFLDSKVDLEFSQSLMKTYSPMEAFFSAMLLSVLFGIFIGNMMIVLNLRLRHYNIAMIVCMIFLAFDILYDRIKISVFKYLYYISPVSMMKTYAYSMLKGTIYYAILFFVLSVILMFTWSNELIKYKNVELEI